MARQRVYPSDLTDEQWEIIEPMLPLIKEPGRVPVHPFRDIVDAILYIARSGCPCRQLPVDSRPGRPSTAGSGGGRHGVSPSGS